MMRLHIVTVFLLLSVAVGNAASVTPVAIGGASGLTLNYINQGAGAVCAAGAGNCIAGTAGGALEKNYDNRLFQGAVNGTLVPVPFNGYSQLGGTASGRTLGQFAMISDGMVLNGSSSNFWDVASVTTMTIPIGILGVNDVWTMLNNIWGPAGAIDTVVTFNFGTSSNGGINNVLAVSLQNAGVGNTTGGQIRSAVDCSAVNCGSVNALNGNAKLANGALAASSTAAATLNGSAAAGINVATSNLVANMFGPGNNSYTGVASGTTYSGSNGTIGLSAQDFNISTFASEYLVSINVQELDGRSYFSNTSLSAITVDQLTPEPSTLFLLITGLGALGLARIRRR